MGRHATHSLRAIRPPDNGALERFELLYRRYFRRLACDLGRRCPNRAAAEDLAQETLIRAFVKLEHFDPSQPLWPWIRAISRRILADHGPRLTREIPTGPSDRAEVSPELAAVEDRAVLSTALARLNRRHRLALGLRYLEDREPRDAAAFLGVSTGAFNQLLLRARERLREEYRRLTDGAPALAGLGWLRTRWRGPIQRFRRRAAELSSFPFSEHLPKAAGTLALLLVFGLSAPLGVRSPPARADSGPAASDPGLEQLPSRLRMNGAERGAPSRVAAPDQGTDPSPPGPDPVGSDPGPDPGGGDPGPDPVESDSSPDPGGGDPGVPGPIDPEPPVKITPLPDPEPVTIDPEAPVKVGPVPLPVKVTPLPDPEPVTLDPESL